MPVLSFVALTRNPKFSAALDGSGDVEVLARVERAEDLVETVDAHRPDALLVSLDTNPDTVFESLEKLLSPRPILIFHGPDESRLILRAMRFGGYEYIAPAPDAEAQLLSAIQRAAIENGGTSAARDSVLISMIGAKGGVGTSFVACQLAASLARLDQRVAIVDGHLRHGDIALYLDLAPKYNFASLAASEGSIDSTYLQAALASHASGLSVLAAPKNPEEAVAITPACVTEVLELLRPEFDWVIWDTPEDFDDRSIRILEQANPIVLITTPDVPSLSHTKMQLELFSRLGRGDDEIRVVLNRTDSRASVSESEAKDFLKRDVDASIPNDFPRASACVNEGRTLADVAPRSPIARAVDKLAIEAHRWGGRAAPVETRRGFLDRVKNLRGN